MKPIGQKRRLKNKLNWRERSVYEYSYVMDVKALAMASMLFGGTLRMFRISLDGKTTAFANKCKKIHAQDLSGMLGNIFFSNYLFLPDEHTVGGNA